MGKHAKSKVPLSALVPVELAGAIEKWVKENPDATRTDFATKALTEKLRKYGVEPLHDSNVSERGAQSGSEAEEKPVQLVAWIQRGMLIGLDKWRRTVRPQMTRSTFLVEAVAELLYEEGLISNEKAWEYGAYTEYRYSTKVLEPLLMAAENLGKIPLPEDCTKADLVKRIKFVCEALSALKHSPPHEPLRKWISAKNRSARK